MEGGGRGVMEGGGRGVMEGGGKDGGRGKDGWREEWCGMMEGGGAHLPGLIVSHVR